MSLVHRARFIEYNPKPIHCIAFDHATTTAAISRSDDCNRVSVFASGLISLSLPRRANGDIEIWDCSKEWYIQRVIQGGEHTSVEALIWINSRLFSAGALSLLLFLLLL